jgi:vitamin B12 transporter
MPALPVDSTEIVITAARAPEERAESAASVTITDGERIERLGEPLGASFLRLVPSAAVSASGPAGSLTEVRIRGAEANHTLLFIDGIRANDPAAGNAPRFELLNADTMSRIEVVRGPQSALWGSEAIGGVVAVTGADETRLRASAEAGSNRFGRASAAGGLAAGALRLTGGVGLQGARGIDSFDDPGGGERDGYRNLSARAGLTWAPAEGTALGASGFVLRGRSEFDGYDPLTFQRADTLDESRNRLAAGRLWGRLQRGGWTVSVQGSHLASTNRNLLDDSLINHTSASRTAASMEAQRSFALAGAEHLIVAAAEWERETFRSRNPLDSFANQRRDRSRTAFLAELRSQWSRRLTTDLAIRADLFKRTADATTLRASALFTAAPGVQLAAAYAEGIAQPSFFDLYGFYPGFFTGNPNLAPERSRGGELSLRLSRGPARLTLTAFRQRLTDEIVENATFTSTLNASGTSKRDGFEAELDWSIGSALQVSAGYAFLDAEQQIAEGDSPSRELRRPRHSGFAALDGKSRRWSYGASLSYSGARVDRRDSFPFAPVRLAAYWLAGARVGYAVTPTAELFVRASNLLAETYQDVFGYRTEGRSVFAGIRLTPRR